MFKKAKKSEVPNNSVSAKSIHLQIQNVEEWISQSTEKDDVVLKFYDQSQHIPACIITQLHQDFNDFCKACIWEGFLGGISSIFEFKKFKDLSHSSAFLPK